MTRRSESDFLFFAIFALFLSLPVACGADESSDKNRGGTGGSGETAAGSTNGGGGGSIGDDGGPFDNDVIQHADGPPPTDGPSDTNRPDAESCIVVPCEKAHTVRHCGDCLDNDSDGLIDLDDPDCNGDPCHTGEWPCGASNGVVQPCGLPDQPECPVGAFCYLSCCLFDP